MKQRLTKRLKSVRTISTWSVVKIEHYSWPSRNFFGLHLNIKTIIFDMLEILKKSCSCGAYANIIMVHDLHMTGIKLYFLT